MFTACQASLLTSIFCHTQSDSKSILRGDLALVLISEGMRIALFDVLQPWSKQPFKDSQSALESADFITVNATYQS